MTASIEGVYLIVRVVFIVTGFFYFSTANIEPIDIFKLNGNNGGGKVRLKRAGFNYNNVPPLLLNSVCQLFWIIKPSQNKGNGAKIKTSK